MTAATADGMLTAGKGNAAPTPSAREVQACSSSPVCQSKCAGAAFHFVVEAPRVGAAQSSADWSGDITPPSFAVDQTLAWAGEQRRQ